MSPNLTPGWRTQPCGIVIHYTVSSTLESTKQWFEDSKSKVSSHIIIDRDGSTEQIVSLEDRAWHAGNSYWAERAYCNNFMLGIELVNLGKLDREHGIYYYNTYGEEVDPLDVQTDIRDNSHWHTWPQVQIDKCKEIVEKWQSKFYIPGTWIVGHNMISPGRKIDPGNIFPWQEFNNFSELNSSLKKTTLSLQSHLSRLGYNVGEIDGIIGPLTSKRWEQFQKDYKIKHLLPIDTINFARTIPYEGYKLN